MVEPGGIFDWMVESGGIGMVEFDWIVESGGIWLNGGIWWNLVEFDWIVESGGILTEWWNLVESEQIVVTIRNKYEYTVFAF